MNRELVSKNRNENYTADIQELNETNGSISLIKMIINSIDEINAKGAKEDNENVKNLIRVLEENSKGWLARMKLMLDKSNRMTK
jgi:hypothetical protein